MDVWRTPNEEEVKYVIFRRKKNDLPVQIMYLCIAIFTIPSAFFMLKYVIEGISDLDKRLICVCVAGIIILIVVSCFTVKELIKFLQIMGKYRAREISIAYGAVQRKWTTHGKKKTFTTYVLRLMTVQALNGW